MQEIRDFIFGIICCAFICSVLNCLVEKNGHHELIHLLSGLGLTLVIITSVTDLDLGTLLSWDISFQEDANYYSNIGEEQARRALQQRIKEETEAYIQAEANQQNVDLAVNITIGAENLPDKVYLHGNVPPSVKAHMECFLEENLSVSKENQIWTG